MTVIIRHIIAFSFLWGSFISFSQEVTGHLYGESGDTLSHAEIYNFSTNTYAFPDEKGKFHLAANLRDTVVLRAPFFEDKRVQVDSTTLHKSQRYYLKGKAVRLGRVNLNRERFDTDQFNADFKAQQHQDIQNKPALYKSAYHHPGVNPVGLIGFIGENVGKLFGKSDDQPKPRTITYEDLDSVFTQDTLFNDSLLVKDFKIKSDHKHLFFSFCATQDLNAALLQPQKRFRLLDQLVECAKAFREALEADEESKRN